MDVNTNLKTLTTAMGLLLCTITFFLLPSLSLFSPSQCIFLTIFIGVVYFWLFSDIPLFATGFIGVTLSTLLGLGEAKEIFANFGHPIIFLFLGGFLIAEAFNKVGLDRRISLYLLSREIIKSLA